MKLTGKRAILASAIAARDEALRRRDVAASAYEACVGEPDEMLRYATSAKIKGQKFLKLRSDAATARERLVALEKEKSDRLARGSATIEIHRHFITNHGDDADTVISTARDNVLKLEREIAKMEVEAARLQAEKDRADAELANANAEVEKGVIAVMTEHAPEFTVALRKALDVALKHYGALRSMHRRSKPSGDVEHLIACFEGLLSCAGVGEQQVAVRDGAAPWDAAYEALKSDAAAPLPIDPAPKPVKAAA